MPAPLFIVFEGLDGSGKTTQISILASYFAAKAEPCLVTLEPSASNPVGQLTRQAMEGAFRLENETLAMLFAADRYQHIQTDIIPALRRGSHVICDRYYYSNFAYQENFERVAEYNRQSMQIIKPDFVFFLDVPPGECMRRISQRSRVTPGDKRGLYENLEKLRRVRYAYFETFERLKARERIVVVDAWDKTPEAISSEILHRIYN